MKCKKDGGECGNGGYCQDDEVYKLRAELERVRLQLAACGVVADSNTKESAERNRAMNREYHSASLDSVIRAVDSEMSLRAELKSTKLVLEAYRREVGLLESKVISQDKEIAEYEARKCENCRRLDTDVNDGIEFCDLLDTALVEINETKKTFGCSAFKPKDASHD